VFQTPIGFSSDPDSGFAVTKKVKFVHFFSIFFHISIFHVKKGAKTYLSTIGRTEISEKWWLAENIV
jgi:hypothetical protein